MRRRTKVIATAAAILIAIGIGSACRKGPKEVAQPVIAALNQYRLCYGHFPANLDELVELRLLHGIPNMPWDLAVFRGSLDYFAEQDLDVFCLSHTEQSWWGRIGPARVTSTGYVSHLDKWVGESGSDLDLTDPLGLAMDRAGRNFRKDRSSKSLDLFVEKTIHYANPSFLYPRLIMKYQLLEALGKGELVDLPDGSCLRYRETDDRAATYYFYFTANSTLSGEYEARISRIRRGVNPADPSQLDEAYRQREEDNP